MMNIMQSYKTIELQHKILDHKNGEKLLKIIQHFYTGDPDSIFYTADHGEWGESPEIMQIYIVKDGMAVFICYISQIYLPNRLPQDYKYINNIKENEAHNLKISFELSWLTMLDKSELRSDYTSFLEAVKNNLSQLCYEKANKNELKILADMLEKKLIAEESNLFMKSYGFSNDLVAVEKNDGSYIVDRFISMSLSAKNTIYSYPFSLLESVIISEHTTQEDMINSIFRVLPSNEEISFNEQKRQDRRK